MPWPLSQDYNEAVQAPHLCFADDELRASRAAANALGLPMPRSGNFADVYELHREATGRRWAVKCFTRQVAGLRERYAAISAHLRQARLPFAVDFQYLEQGGRGRGQWYPVLKMDWVEGQLLNEFVRQHLDRPGMLEALGQVWARVAQRLREAHLAHGDLQHGNVILVPGREAGSLALKLIDYDGMWVPALAQRPSGEAGHPAYQHPQRLREGTYGPEVDRFPVLVIYCAIRALAVGGRALWDRYDNGDNLLFQEQDLRGPRESGLFWELVRLNDPEVRWLADRLSRAAYRPLDETPLLEELLSPVSPPVAATKPGVPAAPAPRAHPVAVPVTEPATPAPRVAEAVKPAPGRALLMAALVGGAVVSGLCCLGLGNLIFVSSLRGPATSLGPVAQARTTSAPAAQGRAQPETVQPPKAAEQTTERRETVLPPKATEPGTPPHSGASIDCVTLRGHTGEILSVCFSPDGTRLASAGDNTVKVWDVRTGQELLTLQGHTGGVLSVCFSPDGTRLASAGDQTVKVWDARTGREQRTLQGHKSFVHCVCFSPDGTRLAGAFFGSVKVWDARTGQEALSLKGHTRAVNSVCFSPDSGSRGADQRQYRRLDVLRI
jgi:hypothetical protein